MARPSWLATDWQRQGGRGQKLKLINFKLDPFTYRHIFFGLSPRKLPTTVRPHELASCRKLVLSLLPSSRLALHYGFPLAESSHEKA